MHNLDLESIFVNAATQDDAIQETNALLKERYIFQAALDLTLQKTVKSIQDVRAILVEYGTIKLENQLLQEQIQRLEAKLALAAAANNGNGHPSD